MKILGISSGHDAGAAIIEDGKIICAINEERLSREKNYWGHPYLAIAECLKMSNTDPSQIDVIALANKTQGGGIQKTFAQGTFRKRAVDFLSYLRIVDKRFFKRLYLSTASKMRPQPEFDEWLRADGLASPIHYVEHHQCHIASAYYTSPFTPQDKVLIATIDSSGDGLSCTLSVLDAQGRIQRKHETSFYHSPSVIYSYVTHNLGFKYLSHEGKITGLAAYGDPEKTLSIFRKVMSMDADRLEFRSYLGCWGRPAARKLHLLCQGYKREDIAAGVQKRIEEVICEFIALACKRYDCDKLALAGGIFANVRLNQKLLELPGVTGLYVHPHMGDGGVGVGAALSLWAEKELGKGKTPAPIKLSQVYLGPGFSEEQIERALKDSSLVYKKHERVELVIAQYLASGKIVGRFTGKMEYGPRALCNRSILYPATDRTVNDWLNKKLNRTEFMPFAPIVTEERASLFLKNYSPHTSLPAEFMTITYDVTDRCKKEAPAVVHVDGTARPQIVKATINPSAHAVLTEYEKITEKAILVNTSFNMHEEPIVCSPEDAIRAFLDSEIDVLAIGDFIVEYSQQNKISNS